MHVSCRTISIVDFHTITGDDDIIRRMIDYKRTNLRMIEYKRTNYVEVRMESNDQLTLMTFLLVISDHSKGGFENFLLLLSNESTIF